MYAIYVAFYLIATALVELCPNPKVRVTLVIIREVMAMGLSGACG